MSELSESELKQRLALCETIIFDMADLTRPCKMIVRDHVCEHIPNRIINSNVGCVFRLAMEYVEKYPNPLPRL